MINTPIGLMSASLVFWGFQSGYVLPGCLIAVLLESSRKSESRWELADSDLNRIWQLCNLLFLGGIALAFSSGEKGNPFSSYLEASNWTERSHSLNAAALTIMVFIQWLPMIFFPLMGAQAWGNRDRIDFRQFSIILRWQKRKQKQASESHSEARSAHQGTNFSFVYFAMILAAASAANNRSGWFYPGLCILVAWVLWNLRSPRYRVSVWIGSFACAVLLGYLGQIGMKYMADFTENLHTAWVSGFGGNGFDDQQTRTAMGRIGELKSSSRIVMRIKPGLSGPVPALLRGTAYDVYHKGTWNGVKKQRAPIQPLQDNITWVLGPSKNSSGQVRIDLSLKNGTGLLPIPNRTVSLKNLQAIGLETNRFGAVHMTGGPGLVLYDALFGEESVMDSPPSDADTSVPESERALITEVADDLGLLDLPIEQVPDAIEKFFGDEFDYSTYLSGESESTPKENSLFYRFLLQDRSGHCEYFAGATVLLLRHVGIPARYAVGYSVQEPRGDGWIVRDLHAHAWALVYIDGHWWDFDTTPASWIDVESAGIAFWQPVSDLLSEFLYRFAKWRYYGDRSQLKYYLVVGLALFFGMTLFKLARRKRKTGNSESDGQKVSVVLLPGQDSEFFRIEQALHSKGYLRQTGECLTDWLNRLESVPELDIESLRPLLALHYRYRFDPGLSEDHDREELRMGVDSWLDAKAFNAAK
ncbi:MAG TPA: transglutaminase domain-containing protein [Verrucomicrobiales bacterium]|nr:transglutaminase domain-containing protein [Verrucomicrobiales bacterium]